MAFIFGWMGEIKSLIMDDDLISVIISNLSINENPEKYFQWKDGIKCEKL